MTQESPPSGANNGSRVILVVDDSKSIRTLFRIYLRKLPVQIQFAEDGVEALEFIKKQTPDLILLDLMMPRMDGATLIDRLNNDPNTQKIPRIVITSRQDISSIKSVLESGITTFMMKPVAIDKLLPLIHSALEFRDFSHIPTTA